MASCCVGVVIMPVYERNNVRRPRNQAFGLAVHAMTDHVYACLSRRRFPRLIPQCQYTAGLKTVDRSYMTCTAVVAVFAVSRTDKQCVFTRRGQRSTSGSPLSVVTYTRVLRQFRYAQRSCVVSAGAEVLIAPVGNARTPYHPVACRCRALWRWGAEH